MDQIPIIDISELLKESNNNKESVAKEIGNACRQFGFFYIRNHGVDPNLETRLENYSREFFALPLEKKLEIRMTLGGKAWRGFFPVGGELTSGRPDMKEGIYFGAELSPDHPLVQAQTPLHGSNLFPPEMPEFKQTVLEYIAIMTSLGHKLMEAMALSLNLKEDYFTKLYTDDPLPLFRIFNYPAQEDTETSGNWGVGEHTDYGILTILKQDDLGGLQVKSHGEWIEAPPVPGTFVCNIGDMLDRMTGGLYRSTPHRVKSPKFKDRLSFPFFFDPNWNSEVRPIQEIHFQRDDKDERWDKASVHQFSGTYGDYLLLKVSKVFPELRKNVI